MAVVIGLPSAQSADRKLPPIIDALGAFAGNQAGSKAIVFSMLGEDCPIPLTHVENIRATGTPFFRSPERAFQALAALKGLSQSPVAIAPAARTAATPLESGTVPEYRAK